MSVYNLSTFVTLSATLGHDFITLKWVIVTTKLHFCTKPEEPLLRRPLSFQYTSS